MSEGNSASSLDEAEDLGEDGSTTLSICRGHGERSFQDEDSIKKHLNKKMARINSFSSLNCANSTLYYEASNYLAELIKTKGTRPLEKVELSGAFYEHGVMEPEEIAQSIDTFFDALEIVGAKEIALSDTTLNQSSAESIASSFRGMHMLQILDLNETLIRKEGSIRIAESLVSSNIRLKTLLINNG